MSGHLLAARVAEAQGRYADSLRDISRAIAVTGDPAPNLRVMVIRAQMLAGHKDEARVAADELESAAAEVRSVCGVGTEPTSTSASAGPIAPSARSKKLCRSVIRL